MANNQGDDLQIVVGGDISPLESELAKIGPAAQAAANAATSAFSSASPEMNAFGNGVNFMAKALEDAAPAAQAAAQSIAGVGSAAGDAAPSLTQVAQGLSESSQQAQSAADAYREFGTQLRDAGTALITIGAALSAVSLAIVDLGSNALETAGNFERVHITLGALLGSSQAASQEMSKLADIANASGQSIDSAFRGVQQMLARGFDVSSANNAFQSLTAASAALNIPIDNLIRSFDSLQTRGTAALQQMARAGIPVWQMLSDAAGTSIAEIREIVRKGGIDTETIMNTLLSNINQKWGALPGQIAESWQGLSTRVSNQIELALNAIGTALLPAAKSIASALIPVIEGIQKVAELFGQLPVPIQDAAIVLGVLAAAVGPATIALGAFLFAAGQITTKLPALAALVGVELPAAFTRTTVAAGEATVAIEANAAAAATAGGAGGGIGLLSGALGTLGKAAGVAAAAFAGWELGKWLSENVPAWGKFFGAAVDGFQSLKDSLTGVGPVSDSALAKITELADKLQAMGVVVERGDMTLKQYGQAVLDAAQKHGLLLTSVGAAASRIDLAAQSVKQYMTAQDQANDAVARTKEALDRANTLYAAHAVGIGVVIRAQNAYTKALADANPQITGAGKAVHDQTVYVTEAGTALDKFASIMKGVPQTAEAMQAAIVQGFDSSKAINSLRDLSTELTNMGADANAKLGSTERVLADLKAMVDKVRQGTIDMVLSMDPSKIQSFVQNGIQILKGSLDTAGESTKQLAENISKNMSIPLAAAENVVKNFVAAQKEAATSNTGFTTTLATGVIVVDKAATEVKGLEDRIGGLDTNTKQLAVDGNVVNAGLGEMGRQAVNADGPIKILTGSHQNLSAAAKNTAQSLTTMQQAQALMNSAWQIGADNAGRVALSVAQIEHAHASATNQLEIAKEVYDRINQAYLDGTADAQDLQVAIQDYIASARAALDPTGQLGGSIHSLAAAANKAGGAVQDAASEIKQAASKANDLGSAIGGATRHVGEFGSSLEGSSTSLENYIGLLDAMGASLYTIQQAAAAAGYTVQTGLKSFDTFAHAFAAFLNIPGYSLNATGTGFNYTPPSGFHVDPHTNLLVPDSPSSSGGGSSSAGGGGSIQPLVQALNGVTTAANSTATALTATTTASSTQQEVWKQTYNLMIAWGNSVQAATKIANDAIAGMNTGIQVMQTLDSSTSNAASSMDAVTTGSTAAADALGAVGTAATNASSAITSSGSTWSDGATTFYNVASDAADSVKQTQSFIGGFMQAHANDAKNLADSLAALGNAAHGATLALADVSDAARARAGIPSNATNVVANGDGSFSYTIPTTYQDPTRASGFTSTSSGVSPQLQAAMDAANAAAAAVAARQLGTGQGFGGPYAPPVPLATGGPAVIGPYDSLQTQLTMQQQAAADRANQTPVMVSFPNATFVGAPNQQVVKSLGDAVATYITNMLRQQAGQKV